jgi:hypothetical protein
VAGVEAMGQQQTNSIEGRNGILQKAEILTAGHDERFGSALHYYDRVPKEIY